MPAAVKQGLKALKEMRAKPQGSRGSGIWKLWLKQNERAEFWFMTDGDNVQVPYIHLLKIPATGSRAEWTKDVACSRGDDASAFCQLCEDEVQGPYQRLVVLTYVTDIFHPKQNTDKEKQWEPRTAKNSDRTVFIEHVNDYRLLICKQKLESQVIEAFEGDVMEDDDRVPTLLDRPYQLAKTGQGQQALEVLKAGTIGPMPEHVADAYKNAPDLLAIVEAEFADSRATRSSGVRTGSAEKGYDPERIPSDADLEEDDADLEDF